MNYYSVTQVGNYTIYYIGTSPINPAQHYRFEVYELDSGFVFLDNNTQGELYVNNELIQSYRYNLNLFSNVDYGFVFSDFINLFYYSELSKEIIPVDAHGLTRIRKIAEINGEIYFLANSLAYGKELYKGTIDLSTSTLNYEKVEEVGVKVYPNPVRQNEILYFDSKEDIEQINLYSLDGLLVKNLKVGNNKGSLNCAGLHAGNYILVAQHKSGKVVSKKIILID